MTNKTRKHIWPVSLVMAIAFIGAVAAIVAIAALPGTASAQPAPPPPPGTTPMPGGGPPPPPPTPDNQAPLVTDVALGAVALRIPDASDPIDVSVAFSDPDDDALIYTAESNNTNVANVSITGHMMVITAGTMRGTAVITVIADDGNGGTAQVSLTVMVAEAYTLTADPAADPDKPYIYVVEDLGPYDAKFHLAVGGSTDDVTVTITAGPVLVVDTDDDNVPDSPDGRISITDSDGLIAAGFVDEEEADLEGSLTVKATDAGSRAFEIEGMCIGPGGSVLIVVKDKDLKEVARGYILCRLIIDPPPLDDRTDRSDAFTVASYDDWMYHDVTDGYIVTDLEGIKHRVNTMTTVAGWLTRDEPVIQPSYILGVSDVEHLGSLANGQPRRPKALPPAFASRTENEKRQQGNMDVEEGQRTIEVLVAAPHVQLTVTSEKSGPAYIRFLNKDMKPFGTDVDEEPMHRGADVVGLDSQGRLAMNMAVELSIAMALAYDQYVITTPGDPMLNSYLTGKAGIYNQGKFRFFNPCPQELGAGHSFYVEVYEQNGKYLETTEKVVCINPPGIVPSELSVTTFSDRPGVARLGWVEAIGAIAHHVIVLDITNPRRPLPVIGTYQKIQAPTTVANISSLREDVEYRFVVVAERGPDSWSMPSFIDQRMDQE